MIHLDENQISQSDVDLTLSFAEVKLLQENEEYKVSIGNV